MKINNLNNYKNKRYRLILKLKSITGFNIIKCKKILNINNYNLQKSILYIKNNNINFTNDDKLYIKKTNEGIINSYIHHNYKIGVLLKINCETDFVAKNKILHVLSKDVCMHIAFSNPLYIDVMNISKEYLNQKKILIKKNIKVNKVNKVRYQYIYKNKLNNLYSNICLLRQSFIKDTSITIKDLINQYINKIKENIVISKFIRFNI